MTNDAVDMAVPELAIGAEYRLLPALLVRAGMRSAVVGGREINTSREAGGDASDPFEHEVNQSIQPSDLDVTLQASGGLALEIKRFRMDAILGGLLLGDGSDPTFFSRIELGFSFD